MRPAVFTIRDLALVGQRLYRRVEICNVHDGHFVSNSVSTDVFLDDGEKCFPIGVGGLDVDLQESGSDVCGEVFLAHVGGRIHTGKDAEIGVAGNGLQGPLFGKCDRGGIALEKTGNALQSLCTGEVDLIKENPTLTSKTEMRFNVSDGYTPISGTKRLDEWSFHKSKSEFPLSPDMLDVKSLKLLFEFVPIRLRYALTRLFYSLSLPRSLLVGAELIAAVEKLLVLRCDGMIGHSPRLINSLRSQLLFRDFHSLHPQGHSPLPLCFSDRLPDRLLEFCVLLATQSDPK